MKYLYLLRHSKAGQTVKRLTDDHERHLTDKGKVLCPKLAEYFKQSELPALEKILSSDSTRTTETVELMVEAMKGSIDIEYDHSLYLAAPEDILSTIHQVSDSVNSLLVCAHNPGLHQLALDLAGTGDKKLYRAMRSNYPPACMAVFRVEDGKGWNAFAQNSAELVDFFIPKK